MRRVLSMAGKDLLRQARTPMAMLFALSFPVVFTTLLALTFGTASGSRMPKVRLLVEDRDGSFLSGAMLSAASSEQMAQYFDVEKVGEDGLARIERNEAAALWRIPDGFEDDLLAGRPVTFELIRNPAQSMMPEIAEQALAVLADLLSSAARVLERPLADLRAMSEAEGGPGAARVAGLSVAVYEIVERAERFVIPPAITIEPVRLAKDGEDAAGHPGGSSGASVSGIFLLILPGISVWALFLIGDMAMRDLLTEERIGTLRRQLCGPLTTGTIVGAKALFTAAVSAIGLVLLAACGWFVTRRTVDPVGFVLLSFAVVLAVTGYAALIYGTARTERQGATVSSVLLMTFAFLGGSFVPLDNLPAGVQRIAPFTPFYWGTTGYQALAREGAGVASILPNVAVLAVLGGALLAIGAALLQRKVARGPA